MVLLFIAFPQASAVADVPDATRNDLALTYMSVMLISITLCATILLRFTLNRAQHNHNLKVLSKEAEAEAAP